MLYLNIKSDELIRVNQHIRVLHLLRLSDKLKISKLSTIKILPLKLGVKVNLWSVWHSVFILQCRYCIYYIIMCRYSVFSAV